MLSNSNLVYICFHLYIHSAHRYVWTRWRWYAKILRATLMQQTSKCIQRISGASRLPQPVSFFLFLSTRWCIAYTIFMELSGGFFFSFRIKKPLRGCWWKSARGLQSWLLKLQPLFCSTVIENGQIIWVSKKRWDSLPPTHKKNPRELKQTGSRCSDYSNANYRLNRHDSFLGLSYFYYFS